ncbi:MAG: aminomethyl-transferring glycine dehydrogenase subunit GcvPB [Erysipelotrichaceae bacterium]|nr:aminomethyl-transferring glycine dehydrogenase subunit GcvPB [Erysipelotrichaceae bacterium]
MKLIYETSTKDHKALKLPKCNISYELDSKYLRNEKLELPELSEVEIVRHYTALSKETYSVDDGFYPLGSCTMKYNPKLNEEVASFEGFSDIHPLQDTKTVQGALKVLDLTKKYICTITGMDDASFQPAAGAHGEFTSLMLIKKYHDERKDYKRKKIIIPDSAHGTNPASAAMCGFDVLTIKSDNGIVSKEELKKVLSDEIAGIMLTNPNTLGLYEKDILEITKLVHDAGGLAYYDGANLNAIMGISRPGEMGFDCLHLNLHKTFSTPHGGGGPGSGAICCKSKLSKYLPKPVVLKKDDKYYFEENKESIGKVKDFYGNFGIVVRALTYMLSLGNDGIKKTSENAVLNANYIMNNIKDLYDVAIDEVCMHEFVLDLTRFKKETGFSALDVSKRLIDYGIHPPTMYFPLIVHEALMIEPTETESKNTLDEVIGILRKVHEEAYSNSVDLHKAPMTTKYGRMDEITAARNPILKYGDK